MADDSQSSEIIKRELERKSQDRIRVYNPLEEDFNGIWGRLIFPIPGKNKDIGYGPGEAVILRYVAINWATKIIDHILTKEMDEALIKENETRVKKGMSRLTSYEEVEPFQTPYRTDNIENRKKLMQIIWLGVEEEYGMEPAQPQAPQTDTRPIDEQLADIQDKPVDKKPAQAVSEPSKEEKIEEKKEDLISAVAKPETRPPARKMKLDV